MDSVEEEALRGSRGRRDQLGAGVRKKLLHLFQRPPSPGHLHHGPHHVPHHVVQKSVRRDVKGPTQLLPGKPPGLRHPAAISPCLLARLGEGLEGALPRDQSRRSVEQFRVHLSPQGPAPGAMEGRKGKGGKAELIAVAPGQCTIPWVEVFRGRQNGFDPDVPWQKGVHGPMQLNGLPPAGKGHGHHLARGVDSPVGSSRRHHRPPEAGESQEDRLHLTLYGAAPGLELPTQEGGPVVVKGHPEPLVVVGRHAHKLEGRKSQSRTMRRLEGGFLSNGRCPTWSREGGGAGG
jgi:hypothetical protein